MPNGHSGGFLIEPAALKQLVEALTGNPVIGLLATDSKLQDARADEIMRAIEKCPQSPIAVEEQDQKFYIIHISNQPSVWFVISSESPLFAEIRRRHAEWRTEHPWPGWKAIVPPDPSS